jgi:hypothetical protein
VIVLRKKENKRIKEKKKLWNVSRTRAAKGDRRIGEKHATFTANFRAHGAISGGFLLSEMGKLLKKSNFR